MTRGATVSAVWTDFGGVLTPPVTQTLTRFCADAGVPVEAYQAATRAVADHCGVADTMAPLDTPLIDQQVWEKRMERALAELGHPADMSDFAHRWFADRAVNDAWVAMLRQWRAEGVFVGLLSNMPPGWDAHWRAMLPPAELFDDVVLSFQAGARKPEPGIFTLAARRAGVAAEECVLVDDLPANCAGARAAGWHAVRFDDAVQAGETVAGLLATSVRAVPR